MRRPARMQERITFLRPVKGVNEINEDIIEYKPWYTVWAEARPLQGIEIIEGQKIVNTADIVKFICRYLPVTAAMRVQWRGQEYNINRPPMPISGRRLEIMAINNGRMQITGEIYEYAFDSWRRGVIDE